MAWRCNHTDPESNHARVFATFPKHSLYDEQVVNATDGRLYPLEEQH